MSKSIKEINSKLRELNSKYKDTGLTDGKISQRASASSLMKSKEHNERLIKRNKNPEFRKKVSNSLKEIYAKKQNSMTGKFHSAETIKKMKEKAKGRLVKDSVKKKISNTLSIPIICYHYPSMKFYKNFNSIKQAKEKLNLTGVLHVLKNRTKHCGGYYFEYKNK